MKNVIKRVKGRVSDYVANCWLVKRAAESSFVQKAALFAVLLYGQCIEMSAQNAAAGKAALTQVTTDIKGYIPIVQKLIYAIAGVVAVIGAVSVYIKMNNEEQDVKKSIMMIVGACIFLLAAATALPAMFG